MSPRLRTLIDLVSASAEPDAVLLRRFAHTRDPQAFAELVRRYGRLVWGQCRHLLDSETDADDAFQATFLTLAKSARTLRDTNKLGPWLHGVAYRVCQQAKRLAARRAKREKAKAKAEATEPVADSAWDQAFAAVHDELAKLPDTLRVPFVLCVLEGKGTTEAAEQLGLKLGTFSSRLSRAKQALMDRLTARGLTAGLVVVGAAVVGTTNAPAAVVGRACDLAAGGPVPANIHSLSHGVLQMVTMDAKRWVMAAVLGCGLAAGIGGVMTANGQDKPADKAKALDPKKAEEALRQAIGEAEQARQRAEDAEQRAMQEKAALMQALDQARAERDAAEKGAKRPGEQKGGKQFEFKYYVQPAGYAPTGEQFEKAVKQEETDGYTLVGVVTMKGMAKGDDAAAVPVLVFRRTAVARVNDAALERFLRDTAEQSSGWGKPAGPVQTLDTLALRDENERLKKELAELKARHPLVDCRYELHRLGGDYDTAVKMVSGMIAIKFGQKAAAGLKFEKDKDGVIIREMTAEQFHWLGDAVNGLTGVTAPKQSGK